MSTSNNAPAGFADWASSARLDDVDRYGVPMDAFGPDVPDEFFEILGRLLAINGKIEYLKDRLDHLPDSETNGVRKVEQFTKRYIAERLERHGIVHSLWAFGTHAGDPDVIVGIRYKASNAAFGEVASVSMGDVPDSEKEQVVVQYTLKELRKLLKRGVTTMRIGELGYTEVNMRWAIQQPSVEAER